MDAELLSRYGAYVEKTGWLQVAFGMLSMSTTVGMPSYNVALGFWGVYCAFSKNGRAVFGYIFFLFFSIILDIVFCSMYGAKYSDSGFKFSLAMLILDMFVKLSSLYVSSHFFSALGGPLSMETNVDGSNYSSIGYAVSGNYRPPADPFGEGSGHSEAI